MVSMHVQLLNLKKPIGGIGVFSGAPTCPFEEILSKKFTKKVARNALSCNSHKMKFFFWHGSRDKIFKQPSTYNKVRKLFDMLGLRDSIVRMHTT